jgi:predicted nuclease of predicted toxin-antitoxin system
MKFIVDTQLPPALASFISNKGYDCIHTIFYEEGHLLKDKEIISIAISEGRAIITKDADFKDNFIAKGTPPEVLYLTFGNSTNQELLSYFKSHLNRVMELFTSGAEFVEFNRKGIFVHN